MGFRITTNMMMNTYRFNLMNNTNKLSDARDKVLTGRNFNSYAEDPASAAQAFRLRREWWQTNNQMNNTDTAYNKFHTGWVNLAGIIDKLDNVNTKVASIRGNSGTAGESRTALAQVLRESSESLIQSMNSKLGEQFIFAGNDGLKAPFTWNADHTVLYYRGVNVNAGGVKAPLYEPAGWDKLEEMRAGAIKDDKWTSEMQEWYDYYTHATDKKPVEADNPEPGWLKPGDPDSIIRDDAADVTDLNEKEQAWLDYYNHKLEEPPVADYPGWVQTTTDGKIDPKGVDEYGRPLNMPDKSGDPLEQAWINYFNDQSDLNKLKKMDTEELNIDMGMGLQENDTLNHQGYKLVNGTAFNTALSGVRFIDYGVDEDGDPKNSALLMRELANVFETWGENGQKYLPEKYRDMSSEDLKALMEEDKAVAKEIEDFHNESEAKAFRLMDKMKAAQEHLTEEYVSLDASASFLKTNKERLSTQSVYLNEQVLDIEQINLADAITQFSWDQYCYNAALKVGNQLLSQSLIDYMN